tara:strand:- start:539 stop:958 length:420 start_codon:yes stop_codon:yes gene_type:complete
MPTPPKSGQLKTITVQQLKRAMAKHQTPEALAEHFSTSFDAAMRMIAFIPRSQRPTKFEPVSDLPPKREAPQVYASAAIHDYNPSDEPDDYAMRKERAMMELGSQNLLKRMLQTGCHWLKPESAAPLLHQYGISEPELI